MIRTCDLCLRRAALYPLSYGRPGGQSSAESPEWGTSRRQESREMVTSGS